MIPGGRVDFQFEHQLDDGAVVMLDATATISAYYPAVMYMSNGDPGYPAEGGEVEDMTVFTEDGTEMKTIPDELYDRICEKAQEVHYDQG